MEFTLSFGERRVTNLSSIKCYFFGMTATGRTMSLKDFPGIKMKWMRKATMDEIEGREISMCYEVTSANKVIVQMTCISTNFGRPANKKILEIELIEKAELLTIHGLSGFGSFEGRGKILTKKVPEGISVYTAAPATEQSAATDHGLIW